MPEIKTFRILSITLNSTFECIGFRVGESRGKREEKEGEQEKGLLHDYLNTAFNPRPESLDFVDCFTLKQPCILRDLESLKQQE